MEPYVDAIPLRFERLRPQLARPLIVNAAAQAFHRTDGLRLVGPECRPAEPVVFAGLRPRRRVDALQGGHEVREVLREADRIGYCLERRGPAVDPPVDRP